MIRYLTGIVIATSLLFSCGPDDDTLRQETTDYLLGEWDAVIYMKIGTASSTFDTFYTDRKLHFVDDTLCTTSYKDLFHYSFTFRLRCDQDIGVCNILRKGIGGVKTLFDGRLQIFDDDHFSIHSIESVITPADEVCTADPTATLEYYDTLEIGDPLPCFVLVATRR